MSSKCVNLLPHAIITISERGGQPLFSVLESKFPMEPPSRI